MLLCLFQFLDNGDEFSFGENEDKKMLTLAFGEALLSFLKALPEPLIPYSIQARCAQVTDREEAFEACEISRWINCVLLFNN